MTNFIVGKRAQSIAVPTTFVAPKPPIRSSSLSSPTIESESSHGSQSTPRRLNRKLPPALTESLLALERFQSTTSDDHGSIHEEGSMQYSSYRRDSSGGSSVQSSQTLTPPWNPPTEFVKYTLVVEPPTDDNNCRVYEPGPTATKRIVAPHQAKVEPRMVDTRRPLSLTFDSFSIDDFSRPLSPGYSRSGPISSSSLFKSNWPSRRPQTPTAVPELAPELAPPSLVSDSTASSSGWSALRELEAREREDRLKPKVKETRKERKLRQKTEKENFDPDTPPGLRDLFNASLCEVSDEHGNKTQFGDLVTGKRTIVVFIRHWFCPLCAQYMNSILSDVPLSALEEADVDLVIIGNGSHKMLNGYKNKAFKCPFKMYTDPSLQLYRALGLTRQTGNAGPDSDAGSYLVQTSMEATMQTIKRATKMPLLHSPGHFTQIGGEFVFDGSLNVIYTHRMQTTRDHSPIEDVCAAAGLRLEYIHFEPGPMPPPVHRGSTDGINEWLVERNEALDEIKRRKAARRNGGSGSTVEDVQGLQSQIEPLGVALQSAALVV